MRIYTNSSRIFLASITVAIVVVSAVITAIVFLPGLNGTPTTTTTPTGSTTTGPTNGGRNFGPLAADYLTSRRDDVSFYWIYNCSFVNENLSHYYQQTDESAFVDGVKMWRNETSGYAEILFAPWHQNITGFGEITISDWNTLAGSIIDDGLRQMSDASSHPVDFPATWPVYLHFEVFFDDNTFFFIGFTKNDGKVYIRNGTWSGGFSEWGWPDVTGFSSGYWLDEGGYFETPTEYLYNTITQAVSYPEE